MNDLAQANTGHKKYVTITGILFLILCVLLYLVFFNTNIKGTLDKKSTDSTKGTSRSSESALPETNQGQEGGQGNTQQITENPNPIDLNSILSPFFVG